MSERPHYNPRAADVEVTLHFNDVAPGSIQAVAVDEHGARSHSGVRDDWNAVDAIAAALAYMEQGYDLWRAAGRRA